MLLTHFIALVHAIKISGIEFDGCDGGFVASFRKKNTGVPRP